MIKRYGEPPVVIGEFKIPMKEMFFYQYMPIKFPGSFSEIKNEKRLACFDEIISTVLCDFVGVFGLDRFYESYVYITAKHQYQAPGLLYNRTGWHSDGFMTDDINYIWCDRAPTIFNQSHFTLTMDDSGSLVEMQDQAKEWNDFYYKENTLLRLDQYNIHRVNQSITPGMRTFLKISFSKDKYNLIGNSRNYYFDYNWEMKEREPVRNQPAK